MNKTISYADPSSILSAPPSLPTEIWLQILENTTIYEANHLWTTVRHVSRRFLDYVERLFISTYLPTLAISLALPRRDPATDALRWPGAPIPGAQIVMAFDRITPDQRCIVFRSPAALKHGSEMKSVDELKVTSVLPKERLQTAPAWVFLNNNTFSGLSMNVPGDINWDDLSKVWFWEVEWRKLVSKFYLAKEQQKTRTKYSQVRVVQGRVIQRGRRNAEQTAVPT